MIHLTPRSLSQSLTRCLSSHVLSGLWTFSHLLKLLEEDINPKENDGSDKPLSQFRASGSDKCLKLVNFTVAVLRV